MTRYHVRWRVEGISSGGTGGYYSTSNQHKHFDDAERARAFARRLASVGDEYFARRGGEVVSVSVTPEEA